MLALTVVVTPSFEVKLFARVVVKVVLEFGNGADCPEAMA